MQLKVERRNAQGARSVRDVLQSRWEDDIHEQQWNEYSDVFNRNKSLISQWAWHSFVWRWNFPILEVLSQMK